MVKPTGPQRLVAPLVELRETSGGPGLACGDVIRLRRRRRHRGRRRPGHAGAAAATTDGATPQEAVRALAVGVFDAHPWIGTQLARAPAQSPLLRIFEHLGRQVQALGVPQAAHFTAASALLNYILGVGGQNAANARDHRPGATRAEFLGSVSDSWGNLDPDEYAFTRSVADQLRDHDDREEFLAGIDLIVAGITGITARP
ncbi:TetR/AcrR family transcriptional regulator [Streptomyces sp. ADMS]|uniref:TetR/AcrR family transcriptional regulator n=1 Tax=Streptomyces sp. ADMS TaxID=3071415 RepID=UPI00296E2AF8|nr:TetR/AcrR family transcriptional regulator [Streptomyces sp. ADMS]MDW4903839.1 TetR/AcrR family transcriptional regulator [Streptomyces sp. ADMS]